MMRVRAIQDFSPSQAVGFIFCLKDVIRQEVGKGSRDEKIAAELLKLDSKIDTLALIAFDVYVKCREQVYELRTNEIKNRYSRLLQRAGLLYELPEQEPGGENTTGDNVI